MTKSFIVTVWNNGTFSKNGASYGLKISIADRDNYFKKSKNVQIKAKSKMVCVETSIYCIEL